MRNIIFAAAALLAVAAPGIAAADTGGSVQLTYAGIDSDISSKNSVVALSGVVITDLSADHWRLQVNGATVDTDQYNTSFGYGQTEVHVVYDAGQFQFGGFTGVSDTNGFGWYEYGVEAAVNFDRAQIAVSAAGSNTNFDNISTFAATGSYNLTDNLSVGATVSTTDFANYGSGTDNVNSWGLNIAYTVPNTHVTIGAGYRSTDGSDGDNTNFFGVSLAWNFGDGAAGRKMPGAAALIPDAIADE
jgi:hypothetical protein